MSGRDFDDPRYVAWRAAVRRRDGHRCRRCGGGRGLHCHHIKTWAGHPRLRYVVTNGVTLCRACHRLTAGREQEWEAYCLSLLSSPDALVLRIMARSDDGGERRD